MARCDLLDLYVQHMDETMRTLAYRNRHRPKDVVSRIKRSLGEEQALLRVGTLKKQRLDVDKEWYARWKARRKIPYKEDGLDFANSREENLEPDQHELVNNAGRILDVAGQSEETTTASTLRINETANAFDIDVSNGESTRSSGNDTAPFDERPIDDENPTAESREETTRTVDSQHDVETDENSQFETMEEIGAGGANNLFDDPVSKRSPKWRDGRVPKKYIPPMDKLAKLLRASKYTGAEETIDDRPRRSIEQPRFTRREILDDDGEVILEWDPSDEQMVTFKVIAKTLGYVGIGFNEKNHMKGADILLAWVDDHTGTVNLLVSAAASRLDHRSSPKVFGPAIDRLRSSFCHPCPLFLRIP